MVPSVDQSFTFNRYSRTGPRNVYALRLVSRYGFSNKHFNSFGELTITKRRRNVGTGLKVLTISGGKRVSQFNHDDPINPRTNSFYTLFRKRNYMKIYENWFAGVDYSARFENG